MGSEQADQQLNRKDNRKITRSVSNGRPEESIRHNTGPKTIGSSGKTSINITIIDAIKKLYRDTTARIEIENNILDGFMTTNGLRQGCCMSRILFNINVHEALRVWKKCIGMEMIMENTTQL